MQNVTNYPFVLVHGFSGWGEKDLLSKVAPYWGLFSGNAKKIYKSVGIEAYAPAVGPFTMAWDRACELYAQLVGGTVDYGKVHSEKMGHARYGRTYKKAMIPNWGKPGKDGKTNKINLVGHSYGGPTISLFINLLVNGSEEEKAGTPENELSELFKGGHKDWVHSFTSLAANHNGTDVVEAAEALHLKQPITKLILSAISVLGTSPLMKVWDQHFEQYGLSKPYKFGNKIEFKLRNDVISNILAHPDDISLYNLGVKATLEFTKDFRIFDNIYYFSYAGCKTHKINKFLPQQVPDGRMFVGFKPTALIMGFYRPLKRKSIINKEWYKNDGMVNTISCRAPLNDPAIEYTPGMPVKPGIWNMMPILNIDHNAFVGLGRSKGEFKNFMLEIAENVNALPSID